MYGGVKGPLEIARVEKYKKSRESRCLVGNMSKSLFRLGFPFGSVQRKRHVATLKDSKTLFTLRFEDLWESGSQLELVQTYVAVSEIC